MVMMLDVCGRRTSSKALSVYT